MKNKIFSISLILTSILFGKPNMEKGDVGKKMAEMAGEKSPYYRGKEFFPKDYFLVGKNLPFLVGVALFHPNGDRLNLTKEQLDKIVEIKKKTVPVTVKMAKEIKNMELELAKAIIDDQKKPETQYGLVEKIANMKRDLTKMHIKCISEMRSLLSPQQFEILITLAKEKKGKKGKTQKKVVESSKGKELFTQKCVSCHVLGRPMDVNKVVAPALNGVMRHLKMTYSNKDDAVKFIKDYVINPSESKAICMPQKIKRFGLMPSQKGLVTDEELEIIANWMFDNYPESNFRGYRRGK